MRPIPSGDVACEPRVKLRVGSNEPFVLEVDDEETVEALAGGPRNSNDARASQREPARLGGVSGVSWSLGSGEASQWPGSVLIFN